MSRDIVWTTKFKKDYKKHGAVALLFVRQPHKGNSAQKGIPDRFPGTCFKHATVPSAGFLQDIPKKTVIHHPRKIHRLPHLRRP